MSEQNFSGVQDTMFIPLAARITISQRFLEYFYDKTAMKFQNMEQIKKIIPKVLSTQRLLHVITYRSFCVCIFKAAS